jgi:hypothetical protein
MKRILLLFVFLTISVVSFAQDKPASIATTPEIPPGPSMKETEKWIKNELPNMGRDIVVESSIYKGETLTVETKYEIAKATLTDCTLKLQSVAETFGNPTSETATVTMKDIDLSRLVAVEATPYGDSKASKPSYVVYLLQNQILIFQSHSQRYSLVTQEDKSRNPFQMSKSAFET